jgi:hypothetical protein
MDEVRAKCGNDENTGRLNRQSMDILTPGSRFIIGEFDPLSVSRLSENAAEAKADTKAKCLGLIRQCFHVKVHEESQDAIR